MNNKAKEQLKIIQNDIKKAKTDLSALLSTINESSIIYNDILQNIDNSKRELKNLGEILNDINSDIEDANSLYIITKEDVDSGMSKYKSNIEKEKQELELKLLELRNTIGEQNKLKIEKTDSLIELNKINDNVVEQGKILIKKNEFEFNKIAKLLTEINNKEEQINSLILLKAEKEKELVSVQDKIDKKYAELKIAYDVNNEKEISLLNKEKLLNIKEADLKVIEGRMINNLNNK